MPRHLVSAICGLTKFHHGGAPLRGVKVSQMPSRTTPCPSPSGTGRVLSAGTSRPDLDDLQADPSRYPRSCHVIR